MTDQDVMLAALGAKDLALPDWCVYCLWSRGSVVYVGQSRNLMNRLRSHMGDVRFKPIERVSVVECRSKAEMDSLETMLIVRWQPKFNDRHTDRSTQDLVCSKPTVPPEAFTQARDKLRRWISECHGEFTYENLRFIRDNHPVSRAWVYKELHKLVQERVIATERSEDGLRFWVMVELRDLVMTFTGV